MLEMRLLHRSSLPSELKTFLLKYPRPDWDTHPSFNKFSEFWLQRHQMFRELGGHLIQLSQSMLDRNIDEKEYQRQLFRFSEFTLQQLHTHHMMEDTYFFPEIGSKDVRVGRAIELLETDHVEIEKLINHYTSILTDCLTPIETSARANSLLNLQREFNKALLRHLDDEEEIIVPAALHFGYIR